MSAGLKRVRITDAKFIAQRVAADGVVVIAFVDGRYQIASYGETKEKCARLGVWVDRIADDLNSGRLPAPLL